MLLSAANGDGSMFVSEGELVQVMGAAHSIGCWLTAVTQGRTAALHVVVAGVLRAQCLACTALRLQPADGLCRLTAFAGCCCWCTNLATKEMTRAGQTSLQVLIAADGIVRRPGGSSPRCSTRSTRSSPPRCVRSNPPIRDTSRCCHPRIGVPHLRPGPRTAREPSELL